MYKIFSKVVYKYSKMYQKNVQNVNSMLQISQSNGTIYLSLVGKLYPREIKNRRNTMKQLKKKSSKVVAFLLAIAMVATSLAYTPNSASAASKKVSSVKITKPSTKVLVLKKGKTYKMKVKVTAKKSKYKKVTYKSSKKKVATVSKSGKIKALKKGTTKITVTSKTVKRKKATITVKVGTPLTKVTMTGTRNYKQYYWEDVTNQDTSSADFGKVSSVRRSKKLTQRVFSKKKSASASIMLGESMSLKAYFRPSKASYKKVKYTSSNKKVATVNSTGFVFTKGEGTTTIKATAADGSGKSAKVKLTVTPHIEATTPAPTAVVDNRKGTIVEDFEKIAVNTPWDKFTTNGNANPGTMTVVADPLNPNNKVLKVDYHGTDSAFDFSPYFNVDLSQIPNAKATLNNYVGVRLKVRVVSSIGDCQFKSLYGYFAEYGSIKKEMANCCSYEADSAEVAAEPDRYKFLLTNAGFIGKNEDVTGTVNGTLMNNNRYMPQYNNDFFSSDENENIVMDQTKRSEGFAGYNISTKETTPAEYSVKTLDFDRTSTNCRPYLNNSKFDMTFGSTYAGKVPADDKCEYYVDDIELIEGDVPTVPATSVTVDAAEKTIEVGDKFTIVATMAPENTTDALSYASDNAEVATVAANGVVTGIKEGTATITVKANDSVTATVKVTVTAPSEEEVITQNPKSADEAYTVGGTDTDDGIQFDMAADNYSGLTIKLPAEIKDFSKCKTVKYTLKLADGSSTTDKIKFTFAAIDKTATSNYDEAMDNKGRIYETYADVTYEAATQQDNITYDPETGLYTLTFSMIGQSSLDKVGSLMLARNGSSSATAKVTITQIDYTMKADGEADPTDAYPFLTVPFTQNYNDKEAGVATSAAFMLPGDVKVAYKETEGVSGSGCVLVPSDEYNGPAVLLDNRKGATDKDFYVEAMAKAATDDDVDGVIQLYAGYSSFVGFAKGGTIFDKMFLKSDKFNKIHDKVTVPAGAFIELRIKGTKDFLLDDIKIAELTDQDITDDDYPEAEPADHIPFGSQLTVDLAQKTTGYGYTAAATEGGIAIVLDDQYQEIRFALPSEVLISMADTITLDFTADANCAIKLLDSTGTPIKLATGEDGTLYGNTTKKVVDLSLFDQTAKVAGVAIMSQNEGKTNALVKSIELDSSKMSVDMTQKPGGYGFTASATEGGIAIVLEDQYQEARYMFPQAVTIADIHDITVKMTADANCAFKLLDSDSAQIGDTSWNNTADKTWDLSTFDQTAKVAGIAIMSQNEGTTNALVSSITVNASTVINADIKQTPGGYGFTIAATEGGIAITLTDQYQEVRYALPQKCTIAEFKNVVVEMTADANCAFKLLDSDSAQIGDTSWNNTADKTWDLSTFDQTAKVAGIAIMSQNEGTTNALLKSITINKK